MKTLTLNIPESLLIQEGVSLDELGHEAQRELAFYFFKAGRLTSGQAAEMAGMTRVDLMSEASRRNIPLIDLDPAELEREVAAATEG